MPNGVAVALPLEPPSHHSPDAKVPIEITIGEAAASAVTVLGAAMLDHQQHSGRLDPAIRDVGGARIAELYALQQSTLGQLNFPDVVRTQGKVQLRRYLENPEFHARFSAEQGDAVIDQDIDGLLEILAKVTLVERAFAN